MIDLRIPPVETERLILRVPNAEDWPHHLAFAQSPERTRFMGGPSDRWTAWRSFTSTIGHWVLRGYGFWSVVEKASGRPAGKVGVIFHDQWPEPELGWHLYEHAGGKGYATEAALRARDHARDALGLTGLISHIDAENIPSINVAKRLGAVFERETTLLGGPTQLWRHPA